MSKEHRKFAYTLFHLRARELWRPNNHLSNAGGNRCLTLSPRNCISSILRWPASFGLIRSCISSAFLPICIFFSLYSPRHLMPSGSSYCQCNSGASIYSSIKHNHGMCFREGEMRAHFQWLFWIAPENKIARMHSSRKYKQGYKNLPGLLGMMPIIARRNAWISTVVLNNEQLQ